MFRRLIAPAVMLAAVFMVIPAMQAHASGIVTRGSSQSVPRVSHMHGHGHTCSYTNPEYMLSDDGMDTWSWPGTMRFTAYHIPRKVHPWEDSYWIIGWHDDNSAICDSRTVKGTGGAKGSTLLPGRLNGPRVTGDLHVTGIRTRPGFDVWLTAVEGEDTPTAMEHDPRTWEILIQPGRWHVHEGFVGWHRAYVSDAGINPDVFDVRGMNLTAIAKRIGVPGWYHWNAIGAGGETPSGHFTVVSYHLHVQGDHPRLRYPKRHHPPARKPRRHGHWLPRHPKRRGGHVPGVNVG